jgi:hypothetical protein
MLRIDEGVYVLHLQGTEPEMAAQHGELMAAEIRQGIIPFMAKMIRMHVEHDTTLVSKLTSRTKAFLIDRLAVALSRNTPPVDREAFQSLAKAAGIAPRTMDLAIGSPDALLCVLAVSDGFKNLPNALGLGLAPRSIFGCCGAIALEDATADGHVIHGRNMDYEGIGHWDRFPTVAFCRPDTGQPFAYVSSAGAHTAALTGMNASGLFLGANTAPTTDVAMRGLPLFSLNDRVIRNARNIEDAIDLLATMRPATGYNVHISHGPTDSGAVVEFSAGKQRVRHPEDGVLVATNHYETDPLRQTIPEVSIVDTPNTESRRKRLTQRVRQARPVVSVRTMIEALRDMREPHTDEIHPLGDVVCNYFNVSSVVADVTARRLFVATGRAPSALGSYISFDFEKELAAFLSERDYPIEQTPPSPFVESSVEECIREYQAAHAELIYERNPEGALPHLEKALDRQPDEPRVILSLGLVSLKADLAGKAVRHAKDYLAITPNDDPRRYRAHLLLGWCSDLASERSIALSHYADAEEAAARAGSHPASFREIRPFKKSPFTESHRRQMDIDLFNAKRMPL